MHSDSIPHQFITPRSKNIPKYPSQSIISPPQNGMLFSFDKNKNNSVVSPYHHQQNRIIMNQNNLLVNNISPMKNTPNFNQNQKIDQKQQYQIKVKQFISKHLTTNNIFNQGVMDIQYMTGSYYLGQIQQNLIIMSGTELSSKISNHNNNKNQQKIKQGYGVYYFSNGDIYYGQFFDNKFHNQGTYIFNNDQYFTGIFSNGQPIKGQYHYKNKNTYHGQFTNSKPNGYGKLIYHSNQNIYFQGIFKQGQQDGIAKLSYQNQFYIQGKWSNGNLIQGRVTYFNLNNQLNSFNQYYQGQFNNQKFHGQGKYYFTPNSFYIGQFSSGKFHGKGRIIYQNNDIYQGNFINGKRHGYGTYFYKNGDVYSGQWLNDMKNGQGKVQRKNGINKICYFQNDKIVNYKQDIIIGRVATTKSILIN